MCKSENRTGTNEPIFAQPSSVLAISQIVCYLFSSSGLYPLSTALAGVLSNQFGPTILFSFGGLLLALAMLFGMTQKVLREV